jgi:acetylornithine deacetylase
LACSGSRSAPEQRHIFLANTAQIIFGEPTAGALVAGHKGALIFRVTAKGRAAHSSMPELGINANSVLIPVLHALDMAELPSSEKFGKSTLNIGRMSGGVACVLSLSFYWLLKRDGSFNVIAESASADLIIRVAAGTADEMKQVVLDKVNSVNPNVTVEWLNPGNGPTNLDVIDGRLLVLWLQNLRSLGTGFESIIVNYGTE